MVCWAAGERIVTHQPRQPEPEKPLDRRAFVRGGAALALSAASYGRVLGAGERIGVGFIGFGLIGKRHVLDFQAQSDARLVALAEAHQGRLEEGLALMGSQAHGHRDFRRLLEQRDVDAVVVSTPDHWHALMTMLACAAGKDVYVEKPLTLFVREGRWMIDVAQRHRRIVQVGTQQRSGAHYQRARDLIRGGTLGPVHSVRMQVYRNIMPGYGSPADCSPPAQLDWDLWLGPAPARPYNPNRALYHFRWFWDYSGGQMTNLGAHALDIAHWVLGSKGPLAVCSMGGRFSLRDNGETPDTQDALFEYPGWTAVWSHREASRGQAVPYPMELFGPRGSLAISRKGFVLAADRKLDPATTIPQFAGAHPTGGPASVSPSEKSSQLWTKPIEDKSGDVRGQLRAHVRNFLDCVRSRRQPVADLESGHAVAVACHLANISLRLGRRIVWNSQREEIVNDAEAARHLVRPYRAPWDRELRALGVG
jgi:predicted dehydrogenase